MTASALLPTLAILMVRGRLGGMKAHRWNNWQKASFACWLSGAALILWPVYRLYSMWKEQIDLGGTDGFIVAMVAGVFLLATGGTLHKVGMSREQR